MHAHAHVDPLNVYIRSTYMQPLKPIARQTSSQAFSMPPKLLRPKNLEPPSYAAPPAVFTA